MRSRWLSVALAVARRTWQKTLSRPVGLTFSFAQPMMWLLFFGFLLQRYPLGSLPGNATYTSFLLPGIAAMTALFGASQSGVAWIRDIQTGFLERMLRTPASRGAILVGKVGADVVRLLGQAVVVVLLGVALGADVRLVPLPLFAALLSLALFAAAFCALSCVIALRSRSPETMATFVHLVNMPIFFTSTALVPAKQMPAWLQSVAAFNPLSFVVDALRGAMLDGEIAVSPPSLAALILSALVLGAVCLREMRRLGGA